MATDDCTPQSTFWETGEPLKQCRRCKIKKPISLMVVEPARRGRRRRHCPLCRECFNDRARAWQIANPEKAYEAKQRCAQLRRLKEYGITHEEFERMLAEQKGACALCKNPERSKRKNGEVRQLAVDHDHATGKVRELLCRACNHALGFLRDDPVLMRACADYIEKHRQ